MTNKRRRLIPVDYVDEEIVSFAQNYEDVLLYRALRGKANGFFVDVGAGDPNYDSVTKWFYTKGWTGINIEPNPDIFHAIEKFRTRDFNENVGVSDGLGVLTYFQVMQNEVGHGWGLSSFDPAVEARAKALGFRVERRPIRVETLDAIIDRCASKREIDFLKIDAEGFEHRVIRSISLKRTRPQVICVEAVEPNSATPSWEAWENDLFSANYQFACFDGVNNYYVRLESYDVLTQLNAPVNCNDRFRRATAEDFASVI